VVFVALAWDAPRRAFARRLGGSGAGLRAYVVVRRAGQGIATATGTTTTEAREVPLHAITAKEALQL
jgi:hypothetical protein